MLRNRMSHLHVASNTGARLLTSGDGSADCVDAVFQAATI